MAVLVVVLVLAAGVLAISALRPRRSAPTGLPMASPAPPGGAQTTNVRDIGSGVLGHGGSSGVLSFDGNRIRVWLDQQLVVDEERDAVQVEWPPLAQGVRLHTPSASLHLLLDDGAPITNMVMTPGCRQRRDATRRRWRELLG